MGGKSYFCDYCQCYMKNDLNVRKTHNSGISHTIAKTTYMKRFEDPKKIYEAELVKTPCRRYVKGMCKFDLYCQYSHYTSKQLKKLKKTVDRLEKKKKNKNRKGTSNRENLNNEYFTYEYAKYIPWLMDGNYREMNTLIQNRYKIKLPPSLKAINFNKNFPNLNSQVYNWG